MADSEQLMTLLSGPEEWNVWREGNGWVEIDLSNADLQNADLQDADLSEAYLQGADLRFANLKEADLQNADLRTADLRNASIQGVILQGADLQNTDLQGTDFRGTDLQWANLQGANLKDANFEGINLQGASLKDADLRETNLQNANLQNANLQNANLHGAYLLGADLQNAYLKDADLSEAYLQDADLRGVSGLDDDAARVALIAGAIVDAEIKLALLRFLESKSIRRSIEFPPEYQEVGVAILTYFAKILRDKYQGEEVGVAIEQHDGKVTMTIQAPGAEPEVIEQTFRDYGLVVFGKKPPEELVSDPIQLAELKTELRILELRVETQRELHMLKDERIRELRSLLEAAITKPVVLAPQATAVAGAIAEAKPEVHFNLGNHLSGLRGTINELAHSLQPGEDKQLLQELAAELVQLDETAGEAAAKESGALRRAGRVLADLGDDESKLGKAAKGARKGFEIAQDVCKRYNSIAEWCGLPVVPRPLLGESKK